MAKLGMAKLGTTLLIGLGGAALLVAHGAALAQAPAGVTAAVNPQASGTPPAELPRILEVGSNVVQNEHLTTGPEGQAQFLFRDGSTLTLGPNSDLTIDNFVYNPETETAKLAMSAATGVFRFVGGRASKDEPVVINTPTATVGIRGGISFGTVTRDGTEISQAYGKDTTATSKSTGELRVLTKSGFSLTVKPNEAITTAKIDLARLNAMLSSFQGRSGANGGATSTPDQNSQQARNVASTNSGQPPSAYVPGSLTFSNPLSLVQSYTTQLVSQASQTITTAAAGGSGTFPFNLGNYNVALVSPSIGLSAANFASIGLGSTPADVNLFNATPFSTSTSFTAGGSTFTVSSTLKEAATVSFASSGIPQTITDSFTFSQSSTCAGTCTAFIPNTLVQSISTSGTISNATIAELGGDNYIRIGRLTGAQVTVSGSGSSVIPNASATYTNQNLPFVIGVPPTLLPTSGQFTYGLSGSTAPIYSNGGPTGSFTGSMSILFTSAQQALGPNNTFFSGLGPGIIVGLTGSVTMPGDGVYSFQTVGGLNASQQLAVIAAGGTGNTLTGLAGSGGGFNGFLTAIGPTSGRACSGSACGASISGILAGLFGSRAGLAYVIGSSTGFTPNSIIGVAFFVRK